MIIFSSPIKTIFLENAQKINRNSVYIKELSEPSFWCFIVNFEHISHPVLVFLLLTLHR